MSILHKHRLVSSIIACLLVMLLFIAPAVAAVTRIDSILLSSSSATTYQPELVISHTANAAMVMETGRMRRLYVHNEAIRQNIPAASKVMTALIACERLPMDTQITISRIAADAESGQTSRDGVTLASGDIYTLEYLLLRMLFYDSDAAAVAIAEQVSDVESAFVDLMNTRAASLELSQTVFRNVTGQPVYFTSTDNQTNADSLASDERDLLQYTTVSDLTHLAAIAYQDQNFSRLIQKESEYMILDGQVLVSMQNQISQLWTLSEQRVHGAFYSARSGQTSSVVFGRFSGIDFVMVTSGGQQASRISDILAIINACSSYYMVDTLVDAGSRFTGEQEQTEDGETFGLVFRKTIYYVRPIDDTFVNPNIRYVSFGPHRRPIQRSMTAGQVIFELRDGTTIAVDVGPDQQILSDITIIDEILNEMQNNPNLTLLLFVSAGLLLLIMFWQIIKQGIYVYRLVQLILLEKRLNQ